MKYFYTLVISICTATAGWAQITLTGAANNPLVGGSYTVHAYNAVALGGPGPAGNGVTWNFASATSLGSASSTYVNPSTGVFASNFPNADAAIIGASQQESYYEFGNELSFWGLVTSGATTIDRYTNRRELLKFPITYGNVFNETFSGTHENFQTTQVFDRGGTIEITADGFGTLITSYGTVNNVLRIRVVTTYADTFMSSNVANYSDSTYMWFNAGTRSSLFSYVKFEFVGIGAPVISGSYLDPSQVGTEDLVLDQGEFSIYPNPAQDRLNISYENHGMQRSTMKVYDLLGKEWILEEDLGAGPGIRSRRIDISALPSGTYLIQLIQGATITTKRLIVE